MIGWTTSILLIVAGAGSGKTRNLACRVARLLAGGVRPERILLPTFSRRAAREMLAETVLGVAFPRCRAMTEVYPYARTDRPTS